MIGEGEKDRILKMDLLAKDAAAGASYLSTRKDILTNKIGFYGLSQGGWVAPYAANIFKNATFIVTVSAPGITPDEQDVFATGNIIVKKIREAQHKAGLKDLSGDSLIVALSNRTLYNTRNKKEIVPGFSWFNPLPYWEKIKCPTLALYGENDELVPAEKSKKLIEDALKKAVIKNLNLLCFQVLIIN
jgi:uncharacterized protein